ncbi:MAG: hypothetical protein IJ874_06260 [Ruminococcus sp.]|nr:hypothetical protein [Ruminococcus sp.]
MKRNEQSGTGRGMKVLTYINIAVILVILFGGFFALLLLRRETVSHEENRELTKFPEFSAGSYLSGEYTEGIADYYDDTVPYRSQIKSLLTRYILPLKGIKYGEHGITIYSTGNSGNSEKNDSTEPAAATETAAAVTTGGTHQTAAVTSAETTTTSTAVPADHEPAANGEVSDSMVIVNGRGLMLYGGGKSRAERYASIINDYRSRLGDSVSVWSMVIPTAVSYYMPENYLSLTGDEKADIDTIAEKLEKAVPIDVYTALLMHKAEDIYSRTDHHWQALGAYYAAQEFAKTAGVPFADISEYERVVLHGYVGTLYGYTKSDELLNDPEDFVYYKPSEKVMESLKVTHYDPAFGSPSESRLFNDPELMDSSQWYLTYGTDDLITHVETGCKNGRILIVFKDSYGNALLPFLTSSFEEIYMCDIRYFYRHPILFAQDVGATDMLFAMCSFSAVGQNQQYLTDNLYN